MGHSGDTEAVVAVILQTAAARVDWEKERDGVNNDEKDS